MTAPQDKPTAKDTQAQYGRQARFYARSAVHSRGSTLESVRRLANATPDDLVLDIGTGTGFTAFAMAESARRVVASDLTPEMLALARRLGEERGLAERLTPALVAAERLPFPDGTFDVITCRTACHHFHDLPAALRETARALKPAAGRFVMSDVVAPEGEGLAELMNELERLRDPSHVWDYPLAAWLGELLPEAGLAPGETVADRTPLVFSEWVERSGTAPEAVAQLRRLFGSMSPEEAAAFEVQPQEDEILFSWPNLTLVAVRA